MTSFEQPRNRIQQVLLACRRITQETMHSVRMKYSSDRYVHRLKAEIVFDRFLNSDRSLFLVLGDSGTGKTNLMCWLASKIVSSHPTLLLTGLWRPDGAVSLMDVLFRQLRMDLKWEISDTWEFVRELAGTLQESGTSLNFLVDGVNETNDRDWVIEGFRDSLKRCPATIRFALSCRTDSFQLHFKHHFWTEYVYQEQLEKAKDVAESLETELETLSKSVYENSNILSTAQQFLIHLAIKKHKIEVKRARLQRMQSVSSVASVVLETFTDQELAEAIRKYGTTANLVGDALEDCHDPLVFRLFADTVGRNDAEVSDVFTLSNAERYLAMHISEVTSPENSQYTSSLLSRLARYSSTSRAGESNARNRLVLSSEDTQTAEKLVETGLLALKTDPTNGSPSFVFSFDRILSFVLALDVADGGRDVIVARLSQILRSVDPQVIHWNEARYLLLFLDRLDKQDGRRDCKYWAFKLLRKRKLRSSIMTLLPELRSLSAESVIRVIDRQLWTLKGSAGEEREEEAKACANALSSLCRKGYSSQVLDCLDLFLREPFYFENALGPLCRPLAVCFEQHPEQCGRLLELFCGGLDEIQDLVGSVVEDRFDRRQREYPATQRQLTLRDEIERFPLARLKLIEWMVASAWGTIRSIAAAGLPGIWINAPDAAQKMLTQLENDPDDRVRSSLAEIIIPISQLNIETAVRLCVLLGQDPESAVRQRFITNAITLVSLGHIQLHRVVENAMADRSPKVRAALVNAAAGCLSASESSPGVHQLMKALLSILANDRSSIVRAQVIRGSGEYALNHPEFTIKLLRDITTGPTPEPLRANIIESLGSASIDWSEYFADTEAIAIKFGKDPDPRVRKASIPFLCKSADAGCKVASKVLSQLAEDSEMALRQSLLEVNAKRPSQSLITAVIQANVAAPFTGPRSEKKLIPWILGVTDVKLTSLTWKENIDRFRRNVGLLGILVSLSTLVGSSLVHSFRRASGSLTLDWRISPFPLLIGICLALFIGATQRWLDIRYYTGAISRLNKKLLLWVSIPLFLGLLLFLVTSLITKSSEILLIVGGVVVAVATACGAALLYREPFNQICLIVGCGYYCGLFASTLAGATNSGYFGLFFIVCPLLLNLRVNEAFAEFVTMVVVIGTLAAAGAVLLRLFVLWSGLNSLSWTEWVPAHSLALPGSILFALISSVPFALYGFIVLWLRRSWLAGASASLLWVCAIVFAGEFRGWDWDAIVIAGLSAVGIHFIFVIPAQPKLFWPSLLIAVSAAGFAYEGATKEYWVVPALTSLIVAMLVVAGKLIRGPREELDTERDMQLQREKMERQYKTVWICGLAALIGFVLTPFICACSAALKRALDRVGTIATGHQRFEWFASTGLVSLALFLMFATARLRFSRSYRIVVAGLLFAAISAVALFVAPGVISLFILAIATLVLIWLGVIALRNSPAFGQELALFFVAPQLALLVIDIKSSVWLGFTITFIAMLLVLKAGLIRRFGSVKSADSTTTITQTVYPEDLRYDL